jgi:predicted ATP-grasp superfamily ATP-dependent carboligase
MKPLRVLVTNARRRKAVPIVRSLGKAGMYVVCADSVRCAAAFCSRYCNEKLVHPDVQSEEFLDFMLHWLSQNHCDVIFPLDDDVLGILSLNKHRLPNPDVLLVPEAETIHCVNDKAWLIPYAASIGIVVPRTTVIRSHTDLGNLDQVELPAIVKPSRSSGGRGLCKVSDLKQLRDVCREAIAEGCSILVQEIVPAGGRGLGYFALYDRKGQLVAQFMHRRIREYPIDGGPSTLREGIWDESLAKIARRLLESLKWVGLAMVEFKEDTRDGIPKLMEINPRFWGSVALPIFSGVDFPVLAAHLTAGLHVQPVLDYEIGKKARWLWPGDMLHFISSVRKGRWPNHFFDFFDSNTRDDMLSIKDPLPAIMFTIECIKKGVNGG